MAFTETETSARDRLQPPARQTWPRPTRHSRPAACRGARGMWARQAMPKGTLERGPSWEHGERAVCAWKVSVEDA